MHIIDRHWKRGFVSGAKPSPQEEAFLSYTFWQNISVLNTAAKLGRFGIFASSKNHLALFFVPLAVALSVKSSVAEIAL